MGLTTMGQAADEREEDRIAQYDNLAHRQQRNILLAQQRDRQYAAMARQMGALGINPNAALGAGNRGAGQGLG
ncbi:MAG: hypothetical protein KGJ06_07585 [Pseudomonadota bacterium]|nr:hypothetical protein [Pseudomonadota bacterium]